MKPIGIIPIMLSEDEKMKLNLKNKSNKIVGKIIGKPKRRDIKNFNQSGYPGLPPRPKYDRCNKGHGLRPVYDYKSKRWIWDCPMCIQQMAKERNVDWRQQYDWPENY